MAAPTFVADEVVTAVKMNSLPKGTLGYAIVTANQAGIGTTITDFTGLTVTVTVPAGRVLKVTGHGSMITAGAATAIGEFREGTTVLGRYGIYTAAAAMRLLMHGSIILAPSAGSHTYKLSARTLSAGTMDLEATSVNPAHIIVEDLGSV